MARVKKTTKAKPSAKPAEKPVAAKQILAKNSPVIPTGIVKSEEMPVRQEANVHFDAGVKKVEEVSDIEIQGDVYGLINKAERLAFFEEVMTIHISEGAEKNAERHIFLSVNGVGPGPGGIPWVPRGMDIPIKRKFVAVLAGARTVRYVNYEEVSPDGERQSKQRANSGDRYPFAVVYDPNPKGREWLSKLRASRRAG
jgi:hypothetical protein